MALNDAVPSTATDVFNRNVQDIDRIVNETANVTTRTGRVMESFPMSTERATTEADRAEAAQAGVTAAKDAAEASAATATTKANEAADSSLTAEQAAQTALATGNYAGQWSTLSGAYSAGISVEHNNIFYALRSNAANIASIQPGVSAEWISINGANLGTAATRDVGTAAGNVMEVGAFGLGLNTAGTPAFTEANKEDPRVQGFFRASAVSSTTPFAQSANIISLGGGGNDFQHQLGFGLSSNSIYLRYRDSVSWFTPVQLWTTGNTTVDGSGFIKEASPIVKLYADKIEANDYKELESCTFERVDTGHYIIKGAPLLSRDGWYIETIKDRNGNIYFTLDYEEKADGLHVKTYTPDYSTGRATNGAPIDINEGRFVTLRFEEDSSLYPAQKEAGE